MLTADLRSYRLPNVRDLPPVFEGIVLQHGGGPGPGGAKGIGETAMMPVAASIANAIEDATGLRITSLPITAAKIRAARQAQIATAEASRRESA